MGCRVDGRAVARCASPGLGQRLPGERLRLRDGRLRANLLRRGRPLPGRAAGAVRRPIRQTEGSGGLHRRCGRGRHLRSPRVGGQLQASSYRQRRPKVQTDGLIANVRLLHLRRRSVLPLLGQLYPPLQHLRPLNRPLQRQPRLETDRMLVLGVRHSYPNALRASPRRALTLVLLF